MQNLYYHIPMKDTALPWWKTTTIYQVYPRSFMDGNGDGIGDFEGIISRLDHIKETGFETLWFSPFFSSPQEDFGYDISNYRDIAPEYGDMQSCALLFEEIHKREMKIVLDLVLNHTSDRHPWFLESRSSRNNPKRDWYLWRDGKGRNGQKPPNNWRSLASPGSGWHYDEKTGQWYWASFLPCQPDLNFRNPEVKKEMLNVVRFWLDLGADGFRLDIFGSIYKEENFTDNPIAFRFFPSPENEGGFFHTAEMIVHRPETFEFAKELRALTEEYGAPERFLVGEIFGPPEILRKYCGGNEANGLHLAFLFQPMTAKMKAKVFRKIIETFEKYFSPPLIPTWVFSNHDRYRRIRILGGDREKAKLNTAVQFTTRGVPCTYYGEEIGMPQTDIDPQDNLDPVGRQFTKYPRFIARVIQRITHGGAGRDGCRTPMQWDGSLNAGFCPEGVSPWLPVHPSCRSINVEAEKNDPDSVYNCYHRFLSLRKNSTALNRGNLILAPPGDYPRCVLSYTRTAPSKNRGRKDAEQVTVLLNFSKRQVMCPCPNNSPELLVSTRAKSLALSAWETDNIKPNRRKIILAPFEGIVVREAEVV
jgi:alpha-glucosidase